MNQRAVMAARSQDTSSASICLGSSSRTSRCHRFADTCCRLKILGLVMSVADLIVRMSAFWPDLLRGAEQALVGRAPAASWSPSECPSIDVAHERHDAIEIDFLVVIDVSRTEIRSSTP